MTTINNQPVSSRAFRDVVGLFATGVTVVLAEADGEIHGMTANAVASVSLDPLLILVCVKKDAHMAVTLEKARRFSINILNENQQNLSNYFAGMWHKPQPPAFQFLPWEKYFRLNGVLGALACEVDEFLEGGDHWIITGRVTALYRESKPANPLLYYTGQYHKLGLE